jgi:hypothetical protein
LGRVTRAACQRLTSSCSGRSHIKCQGTGGSARPLNCGVMRHRAVIAGLLGLVLLGTAYVFGRRAPVEGLPDRIESSDGVHVQASSVLAETNAVASSSTALEPAVMDLRTMSQTFRNSTFVVAIRRAGFYCDDVVSASESADGVWLASCAEKLGYILSVRAPEQFDVRPVAHYFDGLGPVPVERDPSLERLEPQRLR